MYIIYNPFDFYQNNIQHNLSVLNPYFQPASTLTTAPFSKQWKVQIPKKKTLLHKPFDNYLVLARIPSGWPFTFNNLSFSTSRCSISKMARKLLQMSKIRRTRRRFYQNSTLTKCWSFDEIARESFLHNGFMVIFRRSDRLPGRVAYGTFRFSITCKQSVTFKSACVVWGHKILQVGGNNRFNQILCVCNI